MKSPGKVKTRVRADPGAAEPHRKGAKGMKSQKNSKLEIRSSKQIQIIKKHKISNKLVSDFNFWISNLSVSVCFGFRASDFGFYSVAYRH